MKGESVEKVVLVLEKITIKYMAFRVLGILEGARAMSAEEIEFCMENACNPLLQAVGVPIDFIIMYLYHRGERDAHLP